MLLLATLVAGTGCSDVQWREFNPLQTATADGSSLPRSEQGLLAYYSYLGSLNTEQLRSEFGLATSEFQQKSDDFNRLRLVTMLMHPRSPGRNLSKAETLLRSYLKIEHDKSEANFTLVGNRLAHGNRYTALALFLLDSVDRSQAIEAENSIMRSKLEQLKAIESEMNGSEEHRPDS